MKTQTLYNCKLISNGDKVLHAHGQRSGGFEPETVALWKKLAKRGGAMLDVGSYSGLYSILALKHGASWVGAFEPNPVCYERVMDNIMLNGYGDSDCMVWRCALWDSEGQKVLATSHPLTSAGSLKRIGPGYTVDTYTLDSFKLGNVRAIKIDAERAEPEVLRGGMATIERDKPDILIELLDGTDEVQAMLEPLGYEMRPLDKAMWWFGQKK
jgi:FkbM family methyltransferase